MNMISLDSATLQLEGFQFPARLYMNRAVMKGNAYHSAIDSLRRIVGAQPVVGEVVLMPDLTESASLPVGTTLIHPHSVKISPSYIGMDIGCGYRLFSIGLSAEKFYERHKKGLTGKVRTKQLQAFVSTLSAALKGHTLVSAGQIPGILERGESALSEPERESGKRDLAVKSHSLDKLLVRDFGTIGKGNHFVDLYMKDPVFKAPIVNGLASDSLYFLIHTGSRSLGFETMRFFSEQYQTTGNVDTYNRTYFKGVRQASNYAQANRAAIQKKIVGVISELYGDCEVHTILDAAHNDVEKVSQGHKFRKGTQSLKVGELAVIPGSAISPAYVVRGSNGLVESMETITHGAGRKYTRQQLLTKFRKSNDRMESMFRDVVLNVSAKQMIEELPVGYKDVDDVVDTLEEANLAQRVLKLLPLAVLVDRA